MTSASPPKIFPGWFVVAAVFLLLMANAGLGFYGVAVYLDAITAEQSLSTTVVSLATSMYFVISGVTGRVVAPMIERHDIRIIVGIGGIIAGLSLWALGQVSNAATLFAIYAVMAVGVGMSGLVPATTLVTRWFHQRRSVALSVASTGLSFGGLTFTRFASSFIDSDGLAGAAPWLGAMYAGSVFVALLALWPNPSARGVLPDGRIEGVLDVGAARASVSVSYEVAKQSRFFKAISVGFLLVMGAQVGGISQLAKLGTERVDTPTGALAVSTIAGMSVVARLIGGVVASRVPIMAMATTLAFVQSGSLVMMAMADSRASILLAAIVFGATIGNLLMLQPLIVAEAFGLAAYPRIFSVQQLTVTAGVALGPFILGSLRDLSGYRLSYLVAAALSLTGSVVLANSGIWAPNPERIESEEHRRALT